LLPAPAEASRYVRYSVQDDAWLQYGPGTLDRRVARLQSIGVDLVRVTLSWSTIEHRRGKPDWRQPDALLRALHARNIEPVVTLYGSPRWAASGRRGEVVQLPADGALSSVSTLSAAGSRGGRSSRHVQSCGALSSRQRRNFVPCRKRLP
jgi:hypothetical protein